MLHNLRTLNIKCIIDDGLEWWRWICGPTCAAAERKLRFSFRATKKKCLLNEREAVFPCLLLTHFFYVFIGFTARDCYPTLSEKQSLSPSMRELMLLHHKICRERIASKAKWEKEGINGSHLICLCLHIADEPPAWWWDFSSAVEVERDFCSQLQLKRKWIVKRSAVSLKRRWNSLHSSEDIPLISHIYA